ncbi:membrane protein insertase YidC [Salipaludibacillus aurantiacus]|uniref:Membrane protein insertase YidC n=1 Tax=Salipaludibacillus aurantiacus TaxID=1601833 RepID=A0A1H9X2L5_9BACI|nr:membrane protein insertase YidC [Salipaludibacillus aurantiacus]SES40127.1 YidC/Oxa1 family membrane protein insertase [Salipaludibacillus aurantiacus]
MEKNSVFTRLKKYSPIVLIGVLLLLTLSGCQANMEPIDAETAGVFNHYVIYPFSFAIKFLAGIFNGNYGLSIIFMTFLLRLALMPLMMKQHKNQLFMREKMAVIQPEMDEIKAKFKDKNSAEDKQKMQKEMMALYEKHNFNPLTSMGCLPMLIQFPILIGFYYAIMRTPEIAQHNFLWFNLGATDMILPFVAAAVYFVQFKVSQIGIDSAQQKQLAMLGYVTPAIMGVFSFNVAAALPLYWSVGGLFLIFQTVLFKWIYREKQPAFKTAVEPK